MPILSPCDQFRIEYTKLLEREEKAEKYFEEAKKKLSNPMFSDKEKEDILADIDKWTPSYNEIQERLSFLLTEIKFYTPDNIRFGWQELLHPELKGLSEQNTKQIDMIKQVFCPEPKEEIKEIAEPQNMFGG